MIPLTYQFWIAGIALLLFGIAGILLISPSKQTGRRKSRKDEEAEDPQSPVKDWQAVSLKLERHIQAQRREIEEFQKKERALDRDLVVQKEKYAKLQEKLAQERDWQKKEEDDLEKKAKEITTLKTDLRKLQDDLSATHAERLRFEREVREAKSENDSLNQTRRQLELKVQTQDAEIDNMRKQLKDLKWENSQLSIKKDAESWVPKEDYQKLENELHEKEKTLARLREQINKAQQS